MTVTGGRVLAIAILAAFVAFLDGSIITVALPAITAELGGGLVVQQWVVDAYLLTLGSLILIAGSLSDLFGRIVVLRVGLIGFGVTSVACALAPTAELLIVARAAQGVAAALLVPSSLALIMSTFRGAEQSRAIGTWTAWTSAAFIVGPVLGGVLTDALSWRWVFFINVLPIAITLLLLRSLRNERAVEATPVDLAGAALAALGLAGVVFGLIEQATYGFDDAIVLVPLTGGALCLAAFVVRQAMAQHPMVPLGLFRHRNFAVGNIATVFIYAALSLSTVILVLFLQQVAQLSATLSGLVMLPVTLLLILLSSVFGRLAGRYGPRWFMAGGPLVAALGLLSLRAVDANFDFLSQALLGVVVLGLGLAMTVAPLTSAVLGAVETGRAGIASAVNNAVSRIAGLVAIATLGLVAGTVVDGVWLDRALEWCALLLAIGAVVAGVGIQNSRAAKAALPSTSAR